MQIFNAFRFVRAGVCQFSNTTRVSQIYSDACPIIAASFSSVTLNMAKPSSKFSQLFRRENRRKRTIDGHPMVKHDVVFPFLKADE